MTELEDRWRDLGEFIREQRRIGQLSLRKLSEMAGISNPYLSQIERGLRKPSAEILRQIAQALHISAESLYVRAGILEEREGIVDVVAEIRRDPVLNDEQKKTLSHIYESFRAEQQARIDAELAALDLSDDALADLRPALDADADAETDPESEPETEGDPKTEGAAAGDPDARDAAGAENVAAAQGTSGAEDPSGDPGEDGGAHAADDAEPVVAQTGSEAPRVAPAVASAGAAEAAAGDPRASVGATEPAPASTGTAGTAVTDAADGDHSLAR